MRRYSFLDKVCLEIDQALCALTNHTKLVNHYPAEKLPADSLSKAAQKRVAGLMRVNHAGEICAQALYRGQHLVSRNPNIAQKMQEAADEESAHLDWCSKRLDELNSRPSLLNPIWYTGSFCIGVFAGAISDAYSLGFLAETEHQVGKHLKHHLSELPAEDLRSRAILRQMEQDEAKHRQDAIEAGGKELPNLVKWVMAITSKVMVKTAYWL